VLLSEKGVKTFSNNDEFKDFLAKVNSNKDMMKAIFNTAEYYTEKNKYNYAVSVVATADRREKWKELKGKEPVELVAADF